jgi:hypothetical protein
MGDGGVRLSFNRLSGYLDKASKEVFERKRIDKKGFREEEGDQNEAEEN